MRQIIRFVLSILCAIAYQFCFAQDSTSIYNKALNFPDKFFAKIQSKTSRLDRMLTRQTEKYLQRLARKEEKIKRRLYKADSTAAKELFANSAGQYAALAAKLKNESNTMGAKLSGEYLPYTDSLNGALSFLQQNPLLKLSAAGGPQAAAAFKEFNQLQSKLQDADQAREFIRQRKEQIKEALSKYISLPKSLQKAFGDYNKNLYYYSTQLKEYKQMLNDPDKMERKALSLLNQLPAFKDFMKQHSQLAGLFNIPGNYSDPQQSVAGLQTRSQVLQMLNGQIGGGPNAAQALGQQLQSAQQQLNQFKQKLTLLGGGSGNIDMPNFKPNNQKNRPFLKRIELGINMQTQHATRLYPSRTDIAFSVGYKLNDGKTAGVGVGYSIGWGRDIQHVVISNSGINFRSFIDVKMKRSFYASGGFEYNYQRPFKSLQQIKNIDLWSKSCLVGVSKIMDMRSKIFKKTKLQLLFDLLYAQQKPRDQTPIKFRMGYNF
jgi:hypothetical protein